MSEPEALSADVRRLAAAWLAGGVDPARVERMAEHLARWAALLGDTQVGASQLASGLTHLEVPAQVAELLAISSLNTLDATGMAAVAVHLLDIAEAMALATFVPELPALLARSDLSGDAARHVGSARHLKG